MTHAVRTFITNGSYQHVTACEAIGTCAEEGEVARVSDRQSEVVGVLFLLLFEQMPIGEGKVTVVVNDAPALEHLLHTFHLAGFHTAEHIDRVLVGEHLIIMCGSTEVILVNLILVVEEHTALRKHRDRK